MNNEGLRLLKERRSVTKFLPTDLDQDALEQILDAGRWAPSWINSQPWGFIVITESDLKREIGESCSRKTAFAKGRWLQDAAAIIVIVVDPKLDPYHYVEDGAIAAQNMALAAHALGYGSFYLGIYDFKLEPGSVEEEIKNLLDIPESMRVIAVLPFGVPELLKESVRVDLRDLVHYNKYGEKRQ